MSDLSGYVTRGDHVHIRGEGCEGNGCVPVVVIDPEDAGQVERLTLLHLACYGVREGTKPEPVEKIHMRDALREFANPTSPQQLVRSVVVVMPIDECCFRCTECHNIRCYDDGDRGCIHNHPICDRCYPGDCPECQDEAERRIAQDATAGLEAAAAKWLARDPFYRPSNDTDPWQVNPTHPEQRYNAAYHAARKEGA